MEPGRETKVLKESTNTIFNRGTQISDLSKPIDKATSSLRSTKDILLYKQGVDDVRNYNPLSSVQK